MTQVNQLIESGLWPKSKGVSVFSGLPELAEMYFRPFYKGKNGDLYLLPEQGSRIEGNAVITHFTDFGNQAVLVRSDRCSVFDIPLSDQIIGKGILQNQASLIGSNFAEKFGIKTDKRGTLACVSADLEGRSQVIELCRPIEFDWQGETTGLELIFRNYNTGSLYKKFYLKGLDPYGVNLPAGMKEWDQFETAIFTPTTKGEVDKPVPSAEVYAKYGEIVEQLQKLFEAFTDYCLARGVVVVDTKFEVFIDSTGEWVLGDEVLTPESSRFILKKDFDLGWYKSMDKQVLRNYGEGQGWPDYGKRNPGQVMHIAIPDRIKHEVLVGYQHVIELLAE